MNFITDEHVRSLITMHDAIAELRVALDAHGTGRASRRCRAP
jgi:ornithine cyclodeaminase/alanine dehydrogenase-like protein (mu-crystallin family)